MRNARIAVADDEPSSLNSLADCVKHSNCSLVVQAGSTADLVDNCEAAGIDLIIAGTRKLDVRAAATAQHAAHQFNVPLILAFETLSDDALEATDKHVYSLLVKPVRDLELKTALHVALARFRDVKSLQSEVTNLQQSLAERKTIERAKGIVMQHQLLDEPSAFRYLQQAARDRRMKLVDLANSIVLAQSTLSTPARPALSPRN